jgi:hypothetical protein
MICRHHFTDRGEFREGNTLIRALYIMKWVVTGVFVASMFTFLFALLVRLIWNAVIPDVFGLPEITFWQAFGLILLAKLLFGGHGWRRGPNNRRPDVQGWKEMLEFEDYVKQRKDAEKPE